MTHKTAEQFIDALHRLEEAGDADALIALFAEDAEIRHPGHHAAERGREGVRRFWRDYRGTFGRIQSDFHTVTDDGEACFLEWTGRGTVRGDDAVEYEGVTVLELQEGRVRAMRAYFDPTQLGLSKSTLR